MNIAFVTCVQLGLSCIEKIYDIGGELKLLITLRDEKAVNKSGRVYLDDISRKYNLPLLKIENVNDPEVIYELKKHKIDWLFIIGWSQIAKKKLLETPTKGCIGMHPTLLPEGRGRAAIPWAILKKLPQTGVTMFKLDEGVDTGDIIGQKRILLDENITATQLYKTVNEAHIELIESYYNKIVNDEIILKKQDEELATEWAGRRPEDGEILSSMTMNEADLLVRAVTHPYPGAFLKNKNKIIRIWAANFDSKKGVYKLKDGFITPTEYSIEELI